MTTTPQPGPGSPPTVASPASSDPGPVPSEPARGRRRSRIRPLLIAIGGALVLPLVVTASLTALTELTDVFVPKAVDARVVSVEDMEDRYGITFNLVAITAAGGLVDIRFTVVDQEKAERILHDQDTLPLLYVPTTGAVLRAPQPHAHKLEFLDGATYFLLYPNAGGAIQAGVPVSVVINDVRLDPMLAES